MRVLLVEDDGSIVANLSALLKGEGYEVVSTARQSEAIELIARETFDVALVDIALEEGTGFGVCAAVQNVAPEVAVIFLTASDDEFTTVAGLEAGAVDYIAKPFRARELLSRIRAAARKRGGARTVERLGDVEVDISSAVVKKSGREVFLSALEYKLLLLFAQSEGRLVTRDVIRDAIWDSAGEYVSDNAISVYIKRLRDKIEDDSVEPRLIVTVRGLGYKAGEVGE